MVCCVQVATALKTNAIWCDFPFSWNSFFSTNQCIHTHQNVHISSHLYFIICIFVFLLFTIYVFVIYCYAHPVSLLLNWFHSFLLVFPFAWPIRNGVILSVITRQLLALWLVENSEETNRKIWKINNRISKEIWITK